jgi:hypothetical protein
MDTNTKTAVDRDRRRLLGSAMMGLFLASGANLVSSQLAAAPQDVAIRSFRVDIPEEALLDLRHRIGATQWPDRETVDDQSQGMCDRTEHACLGGG